MTRAKRVETYRLTYKAARARTKFEFELRQLPDAGWRVYILKQPSYGRRHVTAHTSHRLSDENGRFVCWRGVLKTKEEAAAVARLWADRTAEFIATGNLF